MARRRAVLQGLGPCAPPPSTPPATSGVSDVPDPDHRRTHRRHRQGGGRLHLRLGPVALPRRERHRRRLDDRPRVRGRGRGGRGRGDLVPAGDFVVVPFCHCDNTCAHCRAGVQSACANQGFTESGQAEYTLVHQAEGSLVKTDGMPDDVADPVAADALRRDGHRLARRRGGRRPRGRDGRRRRRRRGRPVRCAGGVGDGRREGDRDVAARAAPGDRPRSSAPPTSSPSAARRAATRSRRSPGESARTPCSSASAPTRR